MDCENGLLGMKRDVILRLICYVDSRVVLGMCAEIHKWRHHPYLHDSPFRVSYNTLVKICEKITTSIS